MYINSCQIGEDILSLLKLFNVVYVYNLSAPLSGSLTPRATKAVKLLKMLRKNAAKIRIIANQLLKLVSSELFSVILRL